MKVGTYSPWGKIDYVKEVALGIHCVSTPSHGGFKLDRKRNARMPECFRKAGGWYEEDCEWAMVAVVFPDAFTPENVAQAKFTLKNYWPDQWETYSGEKLELKDSQVLREREFARVHANDYVTIAAVGDWHKDVPAGFVGVIATKGGERPTIRSQPEEKQFLVKSENYDTRTYGYVVRPGDQVWTGRM